MVQITEEPNPNPNLMVQITKETVTWWYDDNAVPEPAKED